MNFTLDELQPAIPPCLEQQPLEEACKSAKGIKYKTKPIKIALKVEDRNKEMNASIQLSPLNNILIIIAIFQKD